MGTLAEAAGTLLEQTRRVRPLVHHITNLVTANDVANATLAAGGSPVMAHALEEVAEMTASAAVLVLNLGTLTPQRVESMLAAGRRARERGTPIVLDPVGAGATRFRTESAMRLLRELRPVVVRGNLGELASLTGGGGVVRGVESVGAPVAPQEVVQMLARAYGCVAAVTGPRDWIGDGARTLAVDNGHPMLTAITGSGCMATAVVGCFLAVGDDPLVAAAAGLAYFGCAGERAAGVATGPGSFRVHLLDHLALLDGPHLATAARIVQLEPATR